MKKPFQHLKSFWLALFILSALSSIAQQQFIHTATKANNSCNYDCTILDVPGLNNNPSAILFVTPDMESGINTNPHPIGVYYFKNQWLIFNLDQKAIPVNARFKVEYFTQPDGNHFQYSIKPEDLQRDGSAYINHPALNNNPGAQLLFFISWVPEENRAITNREAINIQYNADAGKWSISNINKKALYARVTYNIALTSGDMVTNPVIDERDTASYKAVEIRELIIKATPDSTTVPPDPVKNDTITLIKTTKTKIQTVDTLPVINKPLDKNNVVPKKTIPPAYDFSKVHICIEKEGNNILPPKPPVTTQPVIPKIKSNGELEPVTTVSQPLSGITELMWTAGDVITVGFFPDGDEFLTSKVKYFVTEWETYANITFQFITDVSKAQIRVGFEKDGTSGSFIGRVALARPAGSKTMNFGWFDTKTNNSEFRRVILHEFGHALGFIHEHQSPNSGIPWDKEKVYAYYQGPPNNWDIATIDAYIFAKYSKTITNSTAYDPLSIMHYDIPAELTTDGSSVGLNTELSALDKTFVRQVYPFPYIPPTVSGLLKTGDDCDEIEFTVEYNVVHKSEVEFVLKPGYDHHNALVNWWKMIGITEKSGIVTGLELNTTKKITANLIDKTKGITFGKAKTLGVHTGLTYTWNPWPAIIGGCRVKLVWRRDSCN